MSDLLTPQQREFHEIMAAPGNEPVLDPLSFLNWAWARFPMSSAHRSQMKLNADGDARARMAEQERVQAYENNPANTVITSRLSLPTAAQIQQYIETGNKDALKKWQQAIVHYFNKNSNRFGFKLAGDSYTTVRDLVPGINFMQLSMVPKENEADVKEALNILAAINTGLSQAAAAERQNWEDTQRRHAAGEYTAEEYYKQIIQAALVSNANEILKIGEKLTPDQITEIRRIANELKDGKVRWLIDIGG